jgi:uncharacterized membrane protein YedE/YeeE
MLDALGEPVALAMLGAFGGLLLGLAARMGRFCSLGAIEDALYGNDTRRVRQWGVAIAVAIMLTFLAEAAGLVDTRKSIYLALGWNPVASIFGGLLFGYGMALAGNCGFGALARLGGGDLRSFVMVLVIGISAYVAMSGPLAYLRIWLFPPFAAEGAINGFAHALADMTGLPNAVFGLSAGLTLMIWSLSHRAFRTNRTMVLWSVVVGIAIVSGWIGTQWVAETGFGAQPIVSHTFSAPVGDAILYLMTASGNTLSFGVGSVAGVAAGAFIGSMFKGHFRWEACEDPRELRRQIVGAVLMGIGATLALGCTVGQGLSAFSVLAFSAPVTVLSIFAGAALGLRQLITGFLPAA